MPPFSSTSDAWRQLQGGTVPPAGTPAVLPAAGTSAAGLGPEVDSSVSTEDDADFDGIAGAVEPKKSSSSDDGGTNNRDYEFLGEEPSVVDLDHPFILEQVREFLERAYGVQEEVEAPAASVPIFGVPLGPPSAATRSATPWAIISQRQTGPLLLMLGLLKGVPLLASLPPRSS